MALTADQLRPFVNANWDATTLTSLAALLNTIANDGTFTGSFTGNYNADGGTVNLTEAIVNLTDAEITGLRVGRIFLNDGAEVTGGARICVGTGTTAGGAGKFNAPIDADIFPDGIIYSVQATIIGKSKKYIVNYDGDALDENIGFEAYLAEDGTAAPDGLVFTYTIIGK